MICRLILLLSLLASPAYADPRIDAIAAAWNKGDSLSVQDNFSEEGIGSQARMGHAAEQGGNLSIINEIELSDKLFAAKIELDGKHEVWVFAECETSELWCAWQRTDATVISAELGQGVDIATTAVGVGILGATEINPLGVALVPLKVLALAYSREQPFSECVNWRSGLDAAGFGAGAANLIVMATGLANPGVAVALAFAGYLIRKDAARETAVMECATLAFKS